MTDQMNQGSTEDASAKAVAAADTAYEQGANAVEPDRGLRGGESHSTMVGKGTQQTSF